MAPVLTVAEVVDDEQFAACQVVVQAVHPTAGALRQLAPLLAGMVRPDQPILSSPPRSHQQRPLAGGRRCRCADRGRLAGGGGGRMSGPSLDEALESHGHDPVAAVRSMIGAEQYLEQAEFPVEAGYIWTTCASVENGNPLFWDEEVSSALTGPVRASTMISVWFRPHHWAPGRSDQALPLQVHFDLKAALELPEAVMTDNTITFYEPVRPGNRLRTYQVLRSVSDEKTTKLGTGRFWVIEVVYRNEEDELVGVESYTGFGYRRAAK